MMVNLLTHICVTRPQCVQAIRHVERNNNCISETTNSYTSSDGPCPIEHSYFFLVVSLNAKCQVCVRYLSIRVGNPPSKALLLHWPFNQWSQYQLLLERVKLASQGNRSTKHYCQSSIYLQSTEKLFWILSTYWFQIIKPRQQSTNVDRYIQMRSNVQIYIYILTTTQLSKSIAMATSDYWSD